MSRSAWRERPSLGGPLDNNVAPATLHGLDQGKKPAVLCQTAPAAHPQQKLSYKTSHVLCLLEGSVAGKLTVAWLSSRKPSGEEHDCAYWLLLEDSRRF